jgi:uncharacterized protein YlxW (UPF0749 family)
MIRKNIGTILIFFLCLFIGAGFMIQQRVSGGQMLYVSPKAITDIKTTINSEKKSLEETRNLVEETRNRLTEYELEEGLSPEAGEALRAKLEKDVLRYGMYAGVHDLEGPGVVIRIDDGTRDLFEGEDLNNLLVHDADILLVINDLKRNGAEAISVNGERLVDTSAVICSGYTVEINNTRYARPFIIRAIGDGARMTASLIGPGGYGTSLKSWGVLFEIELSDQVFIPAFRQTTPYRYVEKAEEVKES